MLLLLLQLLQIEGRTTAAASDRPCVGPTNAQNGGAPLLLLPLLLPLLLLLLLLVLL